MQQIRNANNAKSTDVVNKLYVTANQTQTIAQASVYYLVELTSQSSLNSLYFIPTSVDATKTPRFISLTFTVIDKDETAAPTSGRIKFYDATGKLDTYPMGFYHYKIYEQANNTNLDPANASELEEGIAYVRDYSGNMEEITPDFKEYSPTVSQYVYP